MADFFGTRNFEIHEIIAVIVRRAEERDVLVTKTRLVKFLYLLDLYFAQKEDNTFTGWSWAFVHYGPYCRASTDAIDETEQRGLIEGALYESKFSDEDFKLYRHGELLGDLDFGQLKSFLPIYVGSMLERAIDRWGGDTYGLLDHVYFYTGPMKDAHPGDTLDFSEEEPITPADFAPIKLKPLDDASIGRARQALKKLAQKGLRASADYGIYDEACTSFSSSLSGEETPVGLQGRATIKESD